MADDLTQEDAVTDVVGWMAAAVSTVMFLPQVVRTWRQRHNPAELAGISLVAFGLITVNASLWMSYGVLRSDPQMTFSNMLIVLTALGTIVLVTRGRSLAGPGEPAPGHESPEPAS